MIDQPAHAELIKKYDVPTPRYTSYPVVPHWRTEDFSTEIWVDAVKNAFEQSNETKGISLYLHLPFCESLCTYCACNKRITRNHGVEINYIRCLLREWGHYINIFDRKPIIREVHLGGGTPTFFSAENLKWLVSWLLEEGIVHDDNEFSFEGHPNNTTQEHLETLARLGFRRVSFGVQDLDPRVQKTINRIQPFENLERVTKQGRQAGYNSVSFDLIYGLPHQTPLSVSNTIKKVLDLRPDRISFYSYAHVPWVSPGQRGYSETDLPTDTQKRDLYETGRALLKQNGYDDIGMDHFALPHDPLFHAQAIGRLHRNFMGYTTTQTDLLIGLGTSAISDAKYCYAQNLKKVEEYELAVGQGNLPVFKGHVLTGEDMITKKAILDVACRNMISRETLNQLCSKETVTSTLKEMCEEGILTCGSDGYYVAETGRPFIRNICAALDHRITNADRIGSERAVFSKSI